MTIFGAYEGPLLSQPLIFAHQTMLFLIMTEGGVTLPSNTLIFLSLFSKRSPSIKLESCLSSTEGLHPIYSTDNIHMICFHAFDMVVQAIINISCCLCLSFGYIYAGLLAERVVASDSRLMGTPTLIWC
jgi:hypothetical protein